jgi:hypothetical protein
MKNKKPAISIYYPFPDNSPFRADVPNLIHMGTGQEVVLEAPPGLVEVLYPGEGVITPTGLKTKKRKQYIRLP